MVTTDSAQSEHNIVSFLFDPECRARFLRDVVGRLQAHGIKAQPEPKAGEEGDHGGAIRGMLAEIARAVSHGLAADEGVVVLHAGEDDEYLVAGCAGTHSGDRDGGAVAAVEKLMREDVCPGRGACVRMDAESGVEIKDGFDARRVVVATPIYAADRRVGLLGFADGHGLEGSSVREAKLVLAATIIGGVVEEVTSGKRHEEVFRALAHALSGALESRDPSTKGHSYRVAMYATAIVNEIDHGECGQSDEDLRSRAGMAALLHDIGMVGIPERILLAASGPPGEESEVLKQHPMVGGEILNACHSLQDLVPAVLYHHEHCDGSGYPFGLAGEDIPLLARIIAVADRFDLMTSGSRFGKVLSHEDAIQSLKGELASKFDPSVLRALFRAYEKDELRSVRLPSRPKVSDDAMEATVEKIYGRHLRLIPAVPRVLTAVNSLLDDPAASLKEIAGVLSTDEGLASRVLRLVNSAYYGLPRTVSTIPLATTILGARAIKNHVVNIAYADVMDNLGGRCEEYDLLRRHALKSAAWARAISSTVEGVDSEEAFTAGLIHDIGKALCLRLKPECYGRIIVQAEESGRVLLGVEEEVMGFDHAQIGAWMASRWMFPGTLVNAIRWHHELEWIRDTCEETYRLVRVIHLADIAARASHRSSPGFVSFVLREISSGALRELGSEYVVALETIKAEVEEAERKLEETFALAGAGV